MVRRAPSRTAVSAPDPCLAPEGVVLDADPEGLVLALEATGIHRWVAVGEAARAMGEGATKPLWDRWSVAFESAQSCVQALHGIALAAPDAANAWLENWLAGRNVDSGLNLAGAKWFKTLPEDLYVAGDLTLVGTGISALPATLRVGGSLDVDRTPLTALPAGFALHGGLTLRDTRVTALPEDLDVGGLDAFGLPLTALPERLRVRGDLNLMRTRITALPKGLEVGGFLRLRSSAMVSLPAGLRVDGSLNLRDCSAWDGRIPSDAKVGAGVYSDLHPNGVALGTWRKLHPRGERPGGPEPNGG